MVNQEILGGLELAIAKGESLKQAMMSFFNAGYKRGEIEEAARAFQIKQRELREVLDEKNKKSKKKIKKSKKIKPVKKKNVRYVQKVSNYEAPKPMKKPLEKKGKQKISNYGEKPKLVGKILTFIFIFLLFILLGVLASVFFFKQELIDFFNKFV
ncbi:hypothetical protein KAJ87_00020 [Candidatus Pacearchaeota archaeon]|nr:hypothetical protein [Candidatus Pacearchaeota archaeon]